VGGALPRRGAGRAALIPRRVDDDDNDDDDDDDADNDDDDDDDASSSRRYKYVICPRGNGIDTHRVWEALYLGVVPVVHHTSLMAMMMMMISIMIMLMVMTMMIIWQVQVRDLPAG
jgi:hypothetical protein